MRQVPSSQLLAEPLRSRLPLGEVEVPHDLQPRLPRPGQRRRGSARARGARGREGAARTVGNSFLTPRICFSQARSLPRVGGGRRGGRGWEPRVRTPTEKRVGPCPARRGARAGRAHVRKLQTVIWKMGRRVSGPRARSWKQGAASMPRRGAASLARAYVPPLGLGPDGLLREGNLPEEVAVLPRRVRAEGPRQESPAGRGEGRAGSVGLGLSLAPQASTRARAGHLQQVVPLEEVGVDQLGGHRLCRGQVERVWCGGGETCLWGRSRVP